MARTRKFCQCLYHILGFYQGKHAFDRARAKLNHKIMLHYTQVDRRTFQVHPEHPKCTADILYSVQCHLEMAKRALCAEDRFEKDKYDQEGQSEETEHDCEFVVELMFHFRKYLRTMQRLDWERDEQLWRAIVMDKCPDLLDDLEPQAVATTLTNQPGPA